MVKITIFRLITAALLSVLAATLFYLAETKSRFRNWSNETKQGIIGTVFGVIAILATEFGIPVDGEVMNVRKCSTSYCRFNFWMACKNYFRFHRRY